MASPDDLGAAFGALAAMPSEVAQLRELVTGLGVQLERIEQRLPPLLLSIDDAARHLGVSRSSIKRAISSGDLPHTKIGRLVRVDISAARPLSREKVAAVAAVARRA